MKTIQTPERDTTVEQPTVLIKTIQTCKFLVNRSTGKKREDTSVCVLMRKRHCILEASNRTKN